MTRVSNAAAVEIQCWFRIVQANERVKGLYVRHEQERSLSTIIIQSLFRSIIAKRILQRKVSSTITIQCWFRVVRANEIVKALYAEHEEERNSSTIIIQSLVRSSIAKRRLKMSVSSSITIQRFLRAIIVKKRAEENVQADYNKQQSCWRSCNKAVILVGIVMAVLCLLMNSTFIVYATNSHVKEESSTDLQELTEQAVKTGVLRSDGIDQFPTRIVQNSSIIIDDVFSEKRGQQDINLIEENAINHFLEKVVISQGNFTSMEQHRIVEVVLKSNSFDEEIIGSIGLQLISEWKDMFIGDKIVDSYPSDDRSSMLNRMSSVALIENHHSVNDVTVDHSEIMKVFAEQFRMEHVLSVRNSDSVYI